jgi:protein-S-isoprenylcysteine O-methyltransferase Ste14
VNRSGLHRKPLEMRRAPLYVIILLAGEHQPLGAKEGGAMASGGSVRRILAVCTALAAVHSLLASKLAKDLARRIAGTRYRNGLYRFAFNAKSVLLLAWATQWFLRLPDREIYRLKAPWSWLFRAGQVASLGVLLSAIRVIGVLDFAGISQLHSFLAGLDLDPEPEAQGPPLGADGQIRTAQAFRFTRHPSNLGALGVFLLFPRITVNRLTLTMLVALYVVLGSLHEEHRLRAAYGEPFERYRREVPFLVPWLQR